ncbi:MAG: DUF4118 domain-containing protein [Leptospirales bacterium]|nr:DUF4118 domain-containing protein [Leptospirales bacterium]
MNLVPSGGPRRPADPDLTDSAASKRSRGKLKVFLGPCAGVAATEALIVAAIQEHQRGVDVALGRLAEISGRDLQQLSHAFSMESKAPFSEQQYELDELLSRRPALAVMDQAAQINAPGARHARRYLEILELLDRGIDVLTTAYVDQLESEAVASQLANALQEGPRLPDAFLDQASELVLIDRSPEQFFGVRSGAVSSPAASAGVLDRSAYLLLRERALAIVGRRVNWELRLSVPENGAAVRVRERILVAIGAHPYSARLLRLSRRLAADERAEHFALHVDTGRNLSEVEQRNVARNLELASNMGAVLLQAAGDLAESIAKIAQQHGISQIVLGQSARRSLWDRLLRRPSLAERLMELAPGVDLHLAPDRESEIRRLLPHFSGARIGWRRYAGALAALSVCTAASLFLSRVAPYWAPSILYLSMVSALGVLLGRGPTLFAAASSALLWNLLFIPPRFTLWISRIEDALMLLTYVTVATGSSILTSRLRRSKNNLERREAVLHALFELSSALSRSGNLQQVCQAAAEQFASATGAPVRISAAADGVLRELAAAGLPSEDPALEAVQQWCLRNGRVAGRFSNTLSDALYACWPLLTPEGPVGVVSLQITERPELIRSNLLRSMAEQTALALTRARAGDMQRRLQLMEESERLFQVIMNSLSHELRTPLTTIVGAASALSDESLAEQSTLRRGLVESIADGASRLQGLVAQLLDMSRLESGHMELRRDWVDAGELVHEACQSIMRADAAARLRLEPLPAPVSLCADAALVVQALSLIIDNAIKYSAGPIVIQIVRGAAESVRFRISDCGPAPEEQDLSRLFEKFYRSSGSTAGGTGLGLALSKGIVELHHGALSVQRNSLGGLSFDLEIPRGAPSVNL